MTDPHCTGCGQLIQDPAARFCSRCGTSVASATSAMPPSAEAPTQQLPPFSPPPYTAPPQQGFAAPVGMVAATLPTSGAAVVSLVMGILSWVLLPIIGALAAVIAGHMARSEIQARGGALGGGGMALTGLVLGYVQLGLGCLIFGIVGTALAVGFGAMNANG